MSITRTVGIIIFPLFCLFASLFAFLTDPYFTSELLQSLGKEQSVEPTKQLFLAFAGLAEIPALFNTEEASHMQDVAQLIRAGALLFVAITAIFVYCFRKMPSITRGGFYLLCILFALAIIISFDSLFMLFHLFLFPQGNWTFPADSTIIRTYPFEFFFWYAISISSYAFFLGLALFCQNIRQPRAIFHNTQKFK